jgi:hypothetical protein
VVPIIIAGNDVLNYLQPANELSNAILLPLDSDNAPIESSAGRCAQEIWDRLTNFPYQFKGLTKDGDDPPASHASLRLDIPASHMEDRRVAYSMSREEELIGGAAQRPFVAALARSFDRGWQPFDVFDDVLISLKSILDPELLSYEPPHF